MVVAASLSDVQRFIYLSTAHVYSSPLVGTITEDTCPRNLHPYATSHLAGEHTVLRAGQPERMQSIVLRLSNAFGAPVHKDVNCWMLLINDLCKQAVEMRRLVLHSSGLQYRDFVAMAEVCHVIECLAVNNITDRSMTTFNLASGVSRSVLTVAQLVQERCKQVLGFEPNLQSSAPLATDNKNEFSIHNRRLKMRGLRVSQDLTVEIDRLLLFCDAQFPAVIA
jgi:UDP-glucose 4-epimerase